MSTPADPRRWVWRRVAVFLSLIACFIIVGWAVMTDASGPAAVAAVSSGFTFAGFILAFYVFAPSLEAGWDVLRAIFGGRDADQN